MPSELILIMLFIAIIVGVVDGKSKLKTKKIRMQKPASLLSYLLGE